MVKLNRTTEYGLMALSYIRNKKPEELTSAREIAQRFDLPFEILAKTLQRLKEQGLISSTYGTRGGYVLTKDLGTINLLDFLTIMEGPVGVVNCVSMKKDGSAADSACCDYSGSCSIKPIMSTLNNRIYEFLRRISLDELTRTPLETAAGATSALPVEIVLTGEEP